jgi:CHAD domain-containing protein
VRILAKRQRYAIEALRPLLPKQRTERWYQQACSLQTTLGATRDLMQASMLATTLEANRGLAEFLRGVAVGREWPGG